MSIKVSNIRLSLDEPEDALPQHLARRLGVPPDALQHWRILRKSLDARQVDAIEFVYAAEVVLPEDDRQVVARRHDRTVELYTEEPFETPPPGGEPLEPRPVVIGAGPAGLFAALLLAQHGYRPLILERGKAVKERVADVRAFDAGRPLNPESNYLFGEGGAGTFSDGKLTSRAVGPDVRRVLEIIRDCHGKPSIVYEHRPHLGSNRLPLVVRSLRRRIEELGGEVRFNCRVEDLDLADGRLRGVLTSSGAIPCRVAVLAPGHSARDVYQMLLRCGVPMVCKPFQLGVRIEHPQEQVNRARYGGSAGDPRLGAADYELVVRGTPDLFTFCMCAGGYVMPSVSEPGYFCTNGMSESRHDSPLANSGLVVTINPSDLPAQDELAGVQFQRHYERLAYIAGRSDYLAPIQWAGDFLAGRRSHGSLPSTYRRGTVASDWRPLLPDLVVRALEHGLPVLDRRWRGLFLGSATLVGPEARGSSPVRIVRDRTTYQSPAVAGLYPAGEGAGFAGGIISAAVDGLRAAKAIMARYAPLEARPLQAPVRSSSWPSP